MNSPLRFVIKQCFVAAAAILGMAGPSIAQSPNWVPVTGANAPGYGGYVGVSQATPDGALWISTDGGGMHRSADSGASWIAMNTGLTNLRVMDNLNFTGTAPYKMFVATYGGGVFKSVDGAASWAAANSGIGCTYVTGLGAVAPANTRLLAGTSCQSSSGVYYSDGAGWTLANGLPGNARVNGVAQVYSAAFGVDYLLAITDSGFYKSSDSGVNWVVLPNSPTGPNGLMAQNLRVLYYTNASAVNVTRLLTTVQGAGVFISEDHGNTWTASNTGLPANPMTFGLGWDNIDSTLYVSLDNGGTYKSTNRGASWALAFGSSTAIPAVRRVTRVNANLMVARTFAGPYKSTDGGTTWLKTGTGLPGGWTNNLKMDGVGTVYASAADGVYKFDGANWSKMPGLPSMVGGQVKARGTTVYATTTNFGVYKFSASAGVWQAINTGLPTNLMGRNPKYVGDGVDPNNAFLGLYGDGVYYTSDAGATWTARNTGLTGGALNINSMDVYGALVYISTDVGVYKSTDAGLNWTSVFTPKNAANLTVPSGGVSVDPVTNSTVYVGVFNTSALGASLPSNGVYKSTDSGVTWTQLAGMAGKKIRDVRFVGTSNADLTLVASAWDDGTVGGLFVSQDGGASWTRESTGLTTNLVNSAMATGTGAYVATRGAGLFSFNDTSTASNEWKYFGVWTNGTSTNYGVSYGANDSQQALSGIAVSGGGMSATAVFWPTDLSWHADMQFGATAPPNSNVYTATVTPKSGAVTSTTFSIRVAGFNAAFPSNVQPSGGVNVPDALPVFSWTPPANGITYKYGVNLQDVANGYAQVWNTYNLTGTSITYPSTAPALVPGKTYQINVQTNEFDSATNTTYGATRAETFCYQCTGTGGGGTTTGSNFDQLFISRNSGPNIENFGLGVRYPRTPNDNLVSYAIACPGSRAAGSFGTAISSGAGSEWYNVDLGSTQPSTPFDCTSAVTYSNGTTNVATLTVDKFADTNAYPNTISLTANADVASFQTVTFTNPIAAVLNTRVQSNLWSVNAAGGLNQQLWFVGSTTSPMAYTGPPLTPNTHYQLAITTVDGTSVMHAAQYWIPFCYQCGGAGGGGTGTGTSLNVLAGWNLLGNSVEAPINVAATMSDAANVITVWKWLPGSPATATAAAVPSGWAFYSPALTDGGAAYAASKGYSFLTTINAGEGFWVNAAKPFNGALPAGTPVASSSFKPALTNLAVAGGAHALGSGWSLLGTGDNPTPAEFDAALSTLTSTPPTAGSTDVYLNLTTLWAWSSANGGGWYFWAPALVNNQSLAGYITSKNYIDFGSIGTLAPGVGFWVNMP